jgi:hypothetical protein
LTEARLAAKTYLAFWHLFLTKNVFRFFEFKSFQSCQAIFFFVVEREKKESIFFFLVLFFRKEQSKSAKDGPGRKESLN